MKKLLIAVLCIVALAFSVSAAETHDIYTDFVDFGNTSSETSHSIIFDPLNLLGLPIDDDVNPIAEGGYGDHDKPDTVDYEGSGVVKDMRVLARGSECAVLPSDTLYATFVLDVPTGEQATRLDIRALDGSSGRDSFDVYINDVFIKNIDDGSDIQGDSEIWNTVNVSLSNLEGSLVVKLKPTESQWMEWWDPTVSGCNVWGQVTVNWAGIVTEHKKVIPEFSSIAAGLALAGAGAGFVLLRKRR